MINTLKTRLKNSFCSYDKNEILQILSLFNKDGSFRDVDYSDTTRGTWLTSRHLVHTKILSCAYCDDKSLGEYISKAMEYWFKYDFKNDNWWWNDLGVPQHLRVIMLNCEEILSDKVKSMILDRLHESIDPHWTGTNKLWFAENIVFKGVLTGDEALITKGKNYIAETFFIAGENEEGPQADASFAQHGMQLYNHGYGRTFILNSAKWFEIFNNTPFAFGEDKIKIVTDLYLDGTCKMGRFVNMDFNARSREIVRGFRRSNCDGASEGSMKNYENAAKILAECNSDPEIKDKLLKTVDFYNGKRSNPYSECNTAHWILKYMTHHRDGFYSAVRMSSKDVKGGDSYGVDNLINGENALDGFGGYGVCVYMRDGMEYDDIFPVLDWGCMPGTTTPDVELPLGLGVLSDTEFVGSVSDGFYGISAADFKKTYTYDGETVSFDGKKAYFFFDECVVHLGADLYSNSAKEFHTTYDQCLLNGDVYADDELIEADGEYKTVNCDCVYHNNKAYINLDKAPLKLKAGEAVGSYARILLGESTPKHEVRKNTFTLVRPQENNNYQYAVMPDVTGAKDLKIPFEVISNNGDVQAVTYKNALYAVFYKAGSVEYNGQTVEADNACMVILNDKKLYISTPDKSVAEIKINCNGKTHTVKMPENILYKGQTIEMAL